MLDVRPRLARPSLVLLLMIAALVASACSGDGTEETTGIPDETSAVEANEVADGSGTTEDVPMAAASPIGAFFADGGGFEAAIEEYRLQVRETIVVCMAEQGFEFVAAGVPNRNEVVELQNDLTAREWTTEYGFGISTAFDSVAQNRASNPNQAIFRALSPAEQESWALTLNGIGVAGFGAGSNGISNNRPLEEQGCIGQALIDTGGQEAIEGLGVFGEVYEEGEAALFERREMVEVTVEWSRCMAEAGFPRFAGLGDPEDEVRKRFDEVMAPIAPAVEALSDEEGQALLSGDGFDIDKMPGLDVDALREVQDYERVLAIADLDCFEAEVQAVYEPLRDDFENGLLAEYATEFEAVKNLGS